MEKLLMIMGHEVSHMIHSTPLEAKMKKDKKRKKHPPTKTPHSLIVQRVEFQCWMMTKSGDGER